MGIIDFVDISAHILLKKYVFLRAYFMIINAISHFGITK